MLLDSLSAFSMVVGFSVAMDVHVRSQVLAQPLLSLWDQPRHLSHFKCSILLCTVRLDDTSGSMCFFAAQWELKRS